MQLTPTQIPVDSRTKQLMAVVQTLFSAPTKKNGKKRSGPARLTDNYKTCVYYVAQVVRKY